MFIVRIPFSILISGFPVFPYVSSFCFPFCCSFGGRFFRFPQCFFWCGVDVVLLLSGDFLVSALSLNLMCQIFFLFVFSVNFYIVFGGAVWFSLLFLSGGFWANFSPPSPLLRAFLFFVG